MNEVKSIIEGLTGKERFNGREMYERTSGILASDESTSEKLASIREKLGISNFKYVITGLLRNVFLIELVDDDISTTKMEVRWVRKESSGKKQEKFDESDPRFCSFEDCVNILLKLLTELQVSVQRAEVKHLLKLYEDYSLLPYELPLDYLSSPLIEKSLNRIHCLENIAWIWDERYQKTLKLREILLNPKKNNKSELFSSILKDKIKVKTYLTDRVQTGEHKTNREKRWEAHPESVHFALRRTCLEIEHKLIAQLCHFEGFPSHLFSLLETERVVTKESEVYKCPVTLEPLSFVEFEKQVKNPVHGKSNFQVGHLNPLKLVTDDPTTGHTAENTSWFSADGNRIQGNLSLKEARELLGKILRNYQHTGITI